MSIVSDQNNLLGVNFRKFTEVTVVDAALIKISKLNFAENFVNKTKC